MTDHIVASPPWAYHAHSHRVQGQHKRTLSDADETCFHCPYGDECHMGYPLCPFDAYGKPKERRDAEGR